MRLITFVVALFLAIFPSLCAFAQETDKRPVVVFIGSSSIAMWSTIESDFPSYRVIRRGIGGNADRPDGLLLPELLTSIDINVIGFNPETLVVYAGENDLWVGEKPEDVTNYLKVIVRRIHQALPITRIVFISIKASPIRWNDRGMIDKVHRTNMLLREIVANDPLLRYVDVFNPMVTSEGNPLPEMFTEDKLHLSVLGYQLWKVAVTSALQ